MYLSIWRQYLAACAQYGWTPSIAGAKAYQQLVKLGMRKKWEAGRC